MKMQVLCRFQQGEVFLSECTQLYTPQKRPLLPGTRCAVNVVLAEMHALSDLRAYIVQHNVYSTVRGIPVVVVNCINPTSIVLHKQLLIAPINIHPINCIRCCKEYVRRFSASCRGRSSPICMCMCITKKAINLIPLVLCHISIIKCSDCNIFNCIWNLLFCTRYSTTVG